MSSGQFYLAGAHLQIRRGDAQCHWTQPRVWQQRRHDSQSAFTKSMRTDGQAWISL